MTRSSHESSHAPRDTPHAPHADHADHGQAEPLGHEEVLWRGTPSAATHWKAYAVCIVLCVLIVPIFYALWKLFETRQTEYTLTTQRLQLRQGLFSKRTDELELYRVRDIAIEEPLVYRMFGAGNIIMETSDRTHPRFVIEGIRDPQELCSTIRRQVEEMRQRKRVREIDFE